MSSSLNEVRSWRPEQSHQPPAVSPPSPKVSMKSGLGDRNNQETGSGMQRTRSGLNEVRSWRPEQCTAATASSTASAARLNEVRSWRPEQCCRRQTIPMPTNFVSMKSGLGDRNNGDLTLSLNLRQIWVSMKSGLGDRNNWIRIGALITHDIWSQ